MYDHEHAAFRKLQQIGKEITGKVKPKAVVVFSAHWQAKKDAVQVNTNEITDLIYEYVFLSPMLCAVCLVNEYGIYANVSNQNKSFYGFPSHYYKEKYPNVGSKEVAQKVISAIQGAGMKAEGVSRGLDHGVWASFKCGK